MRALIARRLAGGSLVAGALLFASCRTTVDSLGFDRGEAGADSVGGAGGNGGRDGLGPLTGPASYPNYFHEVLGKSDAEINAKLAAAYDRLFHGDVANEAVYFPVGSDQAYIRDIFHADIRTEGQSWGMLISVELNKQDEFDRLWAYAKTELAYPVGDPNAGYFRSVCDTAQGTTTPCPDPFGFQQFLSALLFAHGRFKTSTRHDYEADALALFEVLREKAAAADGSSLFDPVTHLVTHLPNAASAGLTRPSLEMPAYYELWTQASGESAYTQAATAARAYFHDAAHAVTGLTPMRSQFDGTPVADFDFFGPESYRTHLNVALDRIFFNRDAWQIDEAQKLVSFFVGKGSNDYGQSYTLDGSICLDPCQREPALIAVNGVIAAIAPPSSDRTAFIQAVWDLSPPSGVLRYYPGMLHLLSLLVLGGQYRVY
jgi:oligosaccharide reducing-end xylanase